MDLLSWGIFQPTWLILIEYGLFIAMIEYLDHSFYILPFFASALFIICGVIYGVERFKKKESSHIGQSFKIPLALLFAGLFLVADYCLFQNSTIFLLLGIFTLIFSLKRILVLCILKEDEPSEK